MGTKRGRQQRSLDTEALLLEAAVQALVEHGYAGATTLRIQELAQVTRGRLLHHFPSRDALLVAAVRHLAELHMTTDSMGAEPPEEPAARVDFAVEQMWVSYRRPFFWASAELWLAARHHDELRAALLPAERLVGSLIQETVDALFGPELVRVPAYPDVRALLNSSMRGVALTYSVRPRDADAEPHLRVWKGHARAALL